MKYSLGKSRISVQMDDGSWKEIGTSTLLTLESELEEEKRPRNIRSTVRLQFDPLPSEAREEE